MGRKRVVELEKENYEWWFIIYVDLIIFLFIYFIVMYFMSKFDMDKFKNFIEFLIFVLKGIVYIFENFGFFILEGLFGKNVKGINIDVGGVIKNK